MKTKTQNSQKRKCHPNRAALMNFFMCCYSQHLYVLLSLTVNTIKMPKLILKKLCNKHYPSILVTFLGETEHFSGKIEALRWGILVGKQKHNVQKPSAKSGQPTAG